ncbi:sarcosine oxidase subunit gamma [Sneathiella sp.]|uniref:sarcosine oxidase subunit gamma n=1 Tax=Sneathiella sp. TaxID=1964365 RepID=UPI00356605BA
MVDSRLWITAAAPLAGQLHKGLSELSPRAQVNLRGNNEDPMFVKAVLATIGLKLPAVPNKVVTGDKIKALWLSPDEWLVVGDAPTQKDLVAALESELSGQHVAINDVSANRTIFALTGADSHKVLMKSCDMDFHPRVFGPGDCAQTLIAKSPAIVEQVTKTDFHVYVRGSLGRYVCEWLNDALGEYVIQP